MVMVFEFGVISGREDISVEAETTGFKANTEI
jgi:hypothetical protein